MFVKPNANDIAFIAAKTHLSERNAILLTEEESDLNLVLNEISAEFSKSELDKLSPPIFIKVVLFNKTLTKLWGMPEKNYIANCIIDNATEIIQKSRFQCLPKKENNTEKQLKYFTVLYGAYKEKLKKSQYNERLIGYIAEGFLRIEQRDLSNHLRQWLDILGNLKNEGYLDILEKKTIKKNLISGVDNYINKKEKPVFKR